MLDVQVEPPPPVRVAIAGVAGSSAGGGGQLLHAQYVQVGVQVAVYKLNVV